MSICCLAFFPGWACRRRSSSSRVRRESESHSILGCSKNGVNHAAAAHSAKIRSNSHHRYQRLRTYLVYRNYRQSLFERLRAVLQEKFQVEIPRLTVEEPPQVEMGDYALPIAFELARTLRKAPRKIAEELVAALGSVPGFTGFEVAGAGYINCRLDRNAAAHALAAQTESLPQGIDFILVEHTSINPNKAAHVGHLRNAILGDTLVRMLRAANFQVGVQNYIDNTGVQVADVVVALMHLRQLGLAGVERWMRELATRGERIDYACWDLYAHISQ